MSESEYYAHECMRAELLGLPKPDKDSLPPRPVASEEDEIESDMAEADQVKVAAEEGAEGSEEQKGGMDGVHNILSLTQKKLNNIKCGIGNVGSSFSSSLSGGLSGLSGLSGSLSGFIKQRVGGGEGGPSGGEIPEADESMESSGAPSTAIDRQMLK